MLQAKSIYKQLLELIVMNREARLLKESKQGFIFFRNSGACEVNPHYIEYSGVVEEEIVVDNEL